MGSTWATGLSKVPAFLDAIKFHESIFALPFAYVGMLLAANGLPTLSKFIWITIAMVGARTVGMVANRVIDRHIDARNPRASSRHIPAGILGSKDLIIPAFISFLIFMFAAYKLNVLSFMLAPLAVGYLIFYPFTKRFTWTATLLLGWALAIAPSAAWSGITGSLCIEPIILSCAVACWAGSFDIIYHCQDVEFQNSQNLHSVAKKFGIANAFYMARILDALAVSFLVAVGALCELSFPYFISCAVAAGLLIYKYFLVKPDDLSKLGMAFMRINAFVSLSILSGSSVSLYLN